MNKHITNTPDGCLAWSNIKQAASNHFLPSPTYNAWQEIIRSYMIIHCTEIINLTSTPQHDLSLPSNYPKRVEWPKPNQFPSHLLIFLLPRRVFHLPSSDVKGMSVESICFLATRPQIPRESHSSSHWLLTLAKSDVTLLEYPNFLPPFQIIRWSPTYAPYPTCTHLTSLHVTQAMYLLSKRVVLNLKAPILFLSLLMIRKHKCRIFS